MKPIEHQFRQLAFLQILLGMLAFCIAEGRPVLLVLVGLVAMASWFVTEGPSKAGLDRQMLNLGAVGAVMLMSIEALITNGGQPVTMVGHFTLALQLLLLFARKTRREYIQLAVLSALQMIGGSVLPGGVTLIYGVMLVGYCFLTLLTVLAFQLKSAGDLVHQRHRNAAPASETPGRPDQIIGAHHRLHLRASAVIIALCCGVIASILFIVLPREQQDPFAAALVGVNSVGTQSQVGFNSRIRLGGGSIQSDSPEPVMNLSITQDARPIGSADQSWLVRGAVQDSYDPVNKVWSRPPISSISDLTLSMPGNGLRLGKHDSAEQEASITLRRRSVQNLFTVVSNNGPVAPSYLDASGLSFIKFNIDDQQIESNDALASVLRYEVHWYFMPSTDLREEYEARLVESDLSPNAYPVHRWPYERSVDADQTAPTLSWTVETERVRGYTQRLLKERDLPTDYTNASPETRMLGVSALAEHLRRNYRYTLENPSTPGVDPVIAFLFQTRVGHCELFASGLAAMCRTVGIPARLATGYRASEYNSIGDYYVVRESHAHAWTEVDLGPGAGWHVFDATPPAQVDAYVANNTGLVAQLRELYDFIEFNWIATVITFDKNTQEHMLGAFGSALDQGPDQWLASASDWVSRNAEQVALDTVGRLLAVLMLGVLAVAIISLVRLLLLRHRRMVALQLTALPRTQRRSLARQLRFYITMLEMLERHGRSRSHWQSPFQFARALADEAPLCFEPIIPLTEMFYEVRFGYRDLSDDRLARIRLHLKRLEQNLANLSKV